MQTIEFAQPACLRVMFVYIVGGWFVEQRSFQGYMHASTRTYTVAHFCLNRRQGGSPASSVVRCDRTSHCKASSSLVSLHRRTWTATTLSRFLVLYAFDRNVKQDVTCVCAVQLNLFFGFFRLLNRPFRCQGHRRQPCFVAS